MKIEKLNLQMFAEGGGDGVGTASSASAESGVSAFEGTEKSAKRGKGNPLSDVVYGKQAEPESIADSTQVESTNAAKTKTQAFEDLIKGEYKDEFDKRTQSIINKRFKETKGLEEQLAHHNSIMERLADKYGVKDARDTDALLKAIDADESFYEQEAMERGLTVEQLKEFKELERQNREFKEAEQEAASRAHSQQIYANWMNEAENLKAKYGLDNFDLQSEIQNPDFLLLLKNNVSLESAYKAIHMDEMIGGAMAKTASEVRSQMAAGIASRQARPSENGVSPTSTRTFKTDVNSLSRKDRDEIDRRVAKGAIISF